MRGNGSLVGSRAMDPRSAFAAPGSGGARLIWEPREDKLLVPPSLRGVTRHPGEPSARIPGLLAHATPEGSTPYRTSPLLKTTNQTL